MPPSALTVKILQLPNLPEKGDVSDWLAAGGTAEELLRLAAAAPAVRLADHMESGHATSEGARGEGSTAAGKSDDRTPETGKVDWPDPPGEAAFCGIAGRFVRLVEPYTESDSVAVLAHFLLAAASAIGSGPYARVGASRHPVRDNAVLVGRSSKSRKGDSWAPVRVLMGRTDADWLDDHVKNGLSTGEGLIFAVRDAIEKQEPIKTRGITTGYETVIVDPGVRDKRLLAIEPEFARVLQVMRRETNILSAVVREAWDSGDLRVMTKSSPAQATGAHVAILGHITVEELRRELVETEAVNGFANRFLWLAVRRSKELPEPEPFEAEAVQDLAAELRETIAWASQVGLVERSPDARKLWLAVYSELSAEREGLAGAISARAEAHVLRLSVLYALLDRSQVVEVQHLQAALELWGFAERSVTFIFGDATGDLVADTILRALQVRERTRTEISSLFGRHQAGAAIGQALARLEREGKAVAQVRETEGRPTEVWRYRSVTP